MTIRCPLCEEVIESEVKLADGQHVRCPFCEKKFSFFYNTSEEKSDDVMPVIIASGEEFERYLCEKINQQKGMQCEQTKATGDQGVDLIVRVADKKDCCSM
jgi:sarcosine oxidase delta subunit